jgi:hypothetical protein
MQQTNVKSDDLIHRVKAGLALQGLTLAGFCQKNGIDNANVYRALRGKWNGPAGQEVRNKVISAAGLSRIRPMKAIKRSVGSGK